MLTINDLVKNIDLVNEDSIVFAQRINGIFCSDSKIIALELTDEEMQVPSSETAKLKCPGYEYFLEAYLIRDFLTDLKDLDEYSTHESKANALINYAENDA